MRRLHSSMITSKKAVFKKLWHILHSRWHPTDILTLSNIISEQEEKHSCSTNCMVSGAQESNNEGICNTSKGQNRDWRPANYSVKAKGAGIMVSVFIDQRGAFLQLYRQMPAFWSVKQKRRVDITEIGCINITLLGCTTLALRIQWK